MKYALLILGAALAFAGTKLAIADINDVSAWGILLIAVVALICAFIIHLKSSNSKVNRRGSLGSGTGTYGASYTSYGDGSSGGDCGGGGGGDC
ncbi:hypothetical protein G3R49_11785 [Shewanella sp. WXL01]|uniref:hypothetical protein n=1 Tax=Shewanella sp. WXL01 TaxID=2709721 RepID=UPI0014384406|nr:hypothetical protein [Shewanella sp. WXL01]NKF51235.1 hypothetical protein [Shewanella sp. WXL01]